MRLRTSTLCLPFVVPLAVSCTRAESRKDASTARGVARSEFGKLPDGTAVDLYTLRNRSGVEARIMTYGGIIVSLRTPDRTGKVADIVLGFDSLAGYLHDSPYFGAIIGRYEN